MFEALRSLKDIVFKWEVFDEWSKRGSFCAPGRLQRVSVQSVFALESKLIVRLWKSFLIFTITADLGRSRSKSWWFLRFGDCAVRDLSVSKSWNHFSLSLSFLKERLTRINSRPDSSLSINSRSKVKFRLKFSFTVTILQYTVTSNGNKL